MRNLAIAFTVTLGFGIAESAHADYAGDPGLILELSPGQVPIGTLFDIDITAPSGSFVVLFFSDSPGPTQTPFGELCVGTPLSVFPLVMSGPNLVFDHFIGCLPELVGEKGYFQFIASHPSLPEGMGRSNSMCIEIVDGDCTIVPPPGSFYTYTQGGWGQKCNGGNVGCLRDANFDAVFPDGVVLGDEDRIDGDDIWAAAFSSSMAVQDFLPAGKKPAPFVQDYSDPLKTSAGVFAGQLLSAKLNVGFDEAGVFDDEKGDPAAKLADLVFIANVNPGLLGLTVAEVIELSDEVISGEVVAPVKLNGEKVGESDLSHALDVLNNNFGDGNSGASLGIEHSSGASLFEGWPDSPGQWIGESLVLTIDEASSKSLVGRLVTLGGESAEWIVKAKLESGQLRGSIHKVKKNGKKGKKLAKFDFAFEDGNAARLAGTIAWKKGKEESFSGAWTEDH